MALLADVPAVVENCVHVEPLSMLYCQMSAVAEDVAEIVTPLAVMLEVESDTVGAVLSIVSSVIVVLAVIELIGVPLYVPENRQ